MLLAEATNDRGVLEAAIRRVRTGGGTSLYAAVDRVTRQYLSRIPGRKAIVLFTDGVDTESRDATYQSTLAGAEELDALVYTIQYNTYDDAARGLPKSSGGEPMSGALVTAKGELLADAYKRAHLYLTLLADKTGGRFFYTDTLKGLTGTFERIAKELRQQYSIGYYPKKQSREDRHRIKVSVDVPDAVVRTRKSYVRKS
jgi:VWFA-related protein